MVTEACILKITGWRGLGIQFNSSVDSAFINYDTVVLSDYSAASTPPVGMVWGIYVNSSPFLAQVHYNIIGGWGYSCNTVSYPTVGMIASSIGRPIHDTVDMSCNAVHDMVRGFDFQGSNYVHWFYNEMVRDSFGMYLDAGGKIHQQGNSSTPCDDHWEGVSSTTCSYCSTTCGIYWPGWVASDGIYKTYVNTSADADSSILWFRADPMTYPDYDINGDNGADSLAFPYGYYATLDSITTSLPAVTACMNITSFRTTSGTQPGAIVLKAANKLQEYNLYPNPSNGNLTITQAIDNDAPVKVEIYNMLGLRVYIGVLQFSGGNANINVGNVASGIYHVLLSDDSGDIWNKEIIIEKY